MPRRLLVGVLMRLSGVSLLLGTLLSVSLRLELRESTRLTESAEPEREKPWVDNTASFAVFFGLDFGDLAASRGSEGVAVRSIRVAGASSHCDLLENDVELLDREISFFSVVPI